AVARDIKPGLDQFDPLALIPPTDEAALGHQGFYAHAPAPSILVDPTSFSQPDTEVTNYSSSGPVSRAPAPAASSRRTYALDAGPSRLRTFLVSRYSAMSGSNQARVMSFCTASLSFGSVE